MRAGGKKLGQRISTPQHAVRCWRRAAGDGDGSRQAKRVLRVAARNARLADVGGAASSAGDADDAALDAAASAAARTQPAAAAARR